jgi:hypothetical protein
VLVSLAAFLAFSMAIAFVVFVYHGSRRSHSVMADGPYEKIAAEFEAVADCLDSSPNVEELLLHRETVAALWPSCSAGQERTKLIMMGQLQIGIAIACLEKDSRHDTRKTASNLREVAQRLR